MVQARENVKKHISEKLKADGATNKVLTIPNAISFLRLVLVPFSAYLIAVEHDVLALVVVIICAVSDFLDGFLARKLNQITKLGKIIDPIADRMLIFLTLIMLVYRDFVPVWVLLLVFLREVMLFFQYAQLIMNGYEPIPVKMVGKVGAAALMVSIPAMLLFSSPEVVNASTPWLKGVNYAVWVLLLVSLIVYWVAGVLYCNEAAKILVKVKSRRKILISAVITASIATIIVILVVYFAVAPGN
jgi:cardiolipin synthase